MSIRLVRQASDTPNITNRDDTRMTRFAYGGIDGVIKGYGSELSHSISGSKFVLNSGCIVLQGWEVVVDSWELDLSTVVSTQYHTVYLEVNVASESATIKSTYQTGAFPSIDAGNDLTTYPNGTARLPLYTFVVTNGTISSVTKKFSLLSYYGPRLNSIEERLTKLGFREGSVTVPSSTSTISITAANSSLKRQGNYVIGTSAWTISNSTSKALSIEDIQKGLGNFGTIPQNFIPSEDTVIYISFVGIYRHINESLQGIDLYGSMICEASISSSTGAITIESVPEYNTSTYFFPLSMLIQFGYEAAPLT